MFSWDRVLFSTRSSYLWIPSLPLSSSWRSLAPYFPLFGLRPNFIFLWQHRSCWGFECFRKLHQVEARSLDLGHLNTYFQWRSLLIHWEDNIEGCELYFHILAVGQHHFIPYSAERVEICVISEGAATGWFSAPFGKMICWVLGIYPSLWRYIGGDPFLVYIRSNPLSRSELDRKSVV